jgi:hypothetical protein
VGRDLPRPGSMTHCGTRVCVVGKVRNYRCERGGPEGFGVDPCRFGVARPHETRLGPNRTTTNRKSPTDVVTSAVRGWPQ